MDSYSLPGRELNWILHTDIGSDVQVCLKAKIDSFFISFHILKNASKSEKVSDN